MEHKHHYSLEVEWTGNRGTGTDHYRSYGRDHIVRIEGKPDLLGSADPTFRGDRNRHNPEDLLVAALSACHLMSYLHVCAVNGVVVTSYVDKATGTMETCPDGSGRFLEVVLHPDVVVASEEMIAKAMELHHKAHELCFIANSVNFPVRCQPMLRSATTL
ncbi:MAG TPA: OsmC family protein [Flavobacteriales bacterium]|nr:OsmC family protein [Flavobacteriales bacterium]